MALRQILLVHFVLALPYGVGLIVVPQLVLALLTSQPFDGVGLAVARLLGCAIFALSLMAWRARKVEDRAGLRAIVTFLFVYTACGAVVELVAQMSGQWGVLNWSNPILFAFLALGYGYHLFAKSGSASHG